MALPIGIGLLFQTLYYLVDLYFIAPLGKADIAGVSGAGNATFLVLALTQVLGVGTVVLVSQAVGRKDRADATGAFNQALVLSVIGGGALLVAGYLLLGPYLDSITGDPAAVHAGRLYLYWFLPSLALQFPLATMSAGLRGIGIVQQPVMIQTLSVLLNALLAPFLIAGKGLGHGMGVAGAGLASTISVAFAVVVLAVYFQRTERHITIDPAQWRPRLDRWRRLLAIGLPAGAEYAFLFVNSALVYWAIRGFGSATQAGFGAGSRLMNAVLLPAIAVGFAAGPIAGQNFGAGRADRVVRTFSTAAVAIIAVMVPLTALVQLDPSGLMRLFSSDHAVDTAGGEFLRLQSWNFVAQGLIFTCSSLFQGLGNTRPALLSSSGRLVLFVVPLIWLHSRHDFSADQVWYLSIATVTVQALASLALLRVEFRRRLPGAGAGADPDPGPATALATAAEPA
ncbi:MATE family efflux transporter [Kitasatospora sp. NBC_01287]|uniref:MATE family efflux transporter n=1 Tax=Kitasatospora sp. NBC_01287 TaxID=2903573 RepID=UPI0022590557|nr:MATE family efflux transporter [Kitasatospora sp. NBC_01287]MCX4743983.1 MATE family efflux transporter [Kitasatospora sp. NBC_01287]